MTAAGGLVLSVVCIAIVACALGLAIACWDTHIPTWGPRLIRGAAVAVGAALLLLAILPTIAQVLP